MKRILSVIPFEGIYPPMNGGMLRCINVLHQLTKYFEVTAILLQDKASFQQAEKEYPALKNCTVISVDDREQPADLFSVFPAKYAKAIRYRYWSRTLTRSADDNFLRLYPVLREVLKEQDFDWVILEDMATLDLVRMIRKYQPGIKIIYDAYNVNTRLLEAAFAKGIVTKKNLELTRYLESNLFRMVNTVFTCSKLDLDQLVEMNHGPVYGAVIPNGAGVAIAKNGSEVALPVNSEDILFCGSLDYSPNREGLLWFCKEIWPVVFNARPSVRCMVVGKGDPGDELSGLLQQKGIIYYGRVESVDPYYAKAAIAVVPLLTGSGTRLKILEAMGKRVPVLSTTIGAEGIEYTADENICLADDADKFAQAVLDLLGNRDKARNIANAAYALMMEKYDWNVIGKKMKDLILNN